MDSAATFDRAGSLGIEEEYYVVDETGAPTAGTDELVHESTPPDVLTDRLDHELFKCVIEAQTPTLSGLDEAEGALREMRGALLDHARGHGFEIAAAGLHPGVKWRELEHAQKPRYRRQLDRIQYPQHRNTTAGLHVHVGVDDPDAAMWIANECRWYLPLLLALSANSPYWCGFDTGLASARANVFENLPNTGIPGAFLSYDAFRTFESRMIETEAITDRGEIWWDVRPHSELGTVEIRTPDAQADPDRVLAMVRYVHALVEALRAQYRAAEAPWRPYRDRTVLPNGWAAGGERVIGAVRRELLVENKWRALRYGRSASLLVPGGGVRDVDALAHSEADRLNVPAIAELAASESGAGAQRRHAADGVEALYTSLALQR